MHVNFASSALGGMKIVLCDENCAPLEGYESYTIFGNTVDRPVEFEKELSALKGQRVRLQITLRDIVFLHDLKGGHITPMTQHRSNKCKYYLQSALWAILLAFVSGTYLTTFLSELGYSVSQIGTYSTVLQVVQLLIMIANIFFADSIRNVKKCCAWLSLTHILTCVTLFPLCFMKTVPLQPVFNLIIIVCIFQNLFLGFYNIICYRLPYLIIDMRDYTEVSSKAGVISGICGIVFSVLITFLSTLFAFRWIMACGLVVSAGFSVLSFYLYQSMTVVSEETKKSAVAKPNLAHLFSPVFLYFYLPNLLRGIASGATINAFVLICMKDISADPTTLSALPILTGAGGIIGNFLCELLRRKLSNVQLYFYGCVAVCILSPMAIIGNNTIIFCALFFLSTVASNVLAVGAAAYATEVVDYNRIGMYTSIRMICMTAGQAISAAVLAAVIDSVSSIWILLTGGICFLLSGLMYRFWGKKHPAICHQAV